MGSDPRTSVVDAWCRGSVFVSSSGVNPSLTIQAIAASIAAYITHAALRGKL
ncbi:MAG TPA: hypothetical protein VFU22_02005 [Roseiflexaceae bacterium]|nr:hypothetical protein [Roseiflexaceae bacterium]